MEHKLRFFLIDYENVHENGLDGYEKLTSEDTVIIFCSASASNLNGLILADLQRRGIQFQIKNSQTGTKNAMDFQLATEVGRLIGQNHDGHKCIIISNDQGFQAIKQYWKAERVLVTIQPSILDYLSITNVQQKTENKQSVQTVDVPHSQYATPEQIARLSRYMMPVQTAKVSSNSYPFMTHKEFANAISAVKIENKDKEKAFNIFQRLKGISDTGKRKQQLHGTLCQTFGQETGCVIYRNVKSLIK